MPNVETALTSTTAHGLYPMRITHLHRSPVRHYAEHRSYGWYVDIDNLPHTARWLRPFAGFEAADHLDGAPGETLRQRVDAFLARHGALIPGGRVTALLMPRVLGRTFTPLSLFWCHDAAGAVRCVIAEAQSTDGSRRAYLLPAAEDGPAAVAEGLREAPLAGGGGYFLVRLPRPAETLDLTVSLHRDGHAALVATWRGARRPISAVQVLLLQLTNPLAPHLGRLGLRLQAQLLRLRGLSAAARGPLPEPAGRRAVHTAAPWVPNAPSWATS